MSFDGKDLETLADEGFNILTKANDEVTEKFLKFHRERCVNRDEKLICEDNFLKAMLLLLDFRAAKTRDLNPVLVEITTEEVIDPRLN